MMIIAPTLETERLRLRPVRTEDFSRFEKFMAGERSRFVGGPLTSADSWRGFASEVGQWVLLGFGAWSIELLKNDEYIGQVALLHPVDFPERELGWLLWDGYEGQGFAFEAALCARNFAYEKLGWTTVVSNIDVENERSIKLAQRMGAVLDIDAATPNDGPCHVYRHPSL
ncbi:MAG: GNAT family N-acetyltransferase [Rhizobiaceae bacterium]|nr:GNAT family N-acetyltransferase [Rhizobiaceae bacterium]